MANTKNTAETKRRAVALARRGFSNEAICNALGINKTAIYSKRWSEVLEAIRSAREETREKVFNALMEDESSQSKVFLANKLGVFRPKYKTAKPKSIKEAVDRISDIYAAVAAGEIDADHGKYLAGFVESYIKAKETHELEERLEAIENALEKRK